jgi:hypothetical protein
VIASASYMVEVEQQHIVSTKVDVPSSHWTSGAVMSTGECWEKALLRWVGSGHTTYHGGESTDDLRQPADVVAQWNLGTVSDYCTIKSSER